MIGDEQWSIARLRRILQDFGPSQADAVGLAAQTAHQLHSLENDDVAEEMWRLAREAARAAQPRIHLLRIVTITTDSPGSFAALIRSLRTALDEAGWRSGRGPEVEVLRVANDVDPSVDAEHRQVSVEGIAIHVAPTDVGRRPLPLAEARPFAFRCLRELGWIPSPGAPVWSLDEDFRFESLAPSPRRMFVLRSGGPVLHRLDALIARLSADGADAIVGGSTGAAPVPALGLVLGQIRDLAAPMDANDEELRLAAMTRFSTLPDAYYDLAEGRPPDLRLPMTRGWWREDGAVEQRDVLARLRAGLPVTRPALAAPLARPPSAWAHHDEVSVAGGNTVLLSARALDARFLHARCGGLVSRRGDTTWCIDARSRGARVVRVCLPLFHDRQMRPKPPMAAAREALADALGVGVYRAMLAGRGDDQGAVRSGAQARLELLLERLSEAEVATRELGARRGPFVELADWIADSRGWLRLPTAELTFHEIRS